MESRKKKIDIEKLIEIYKKMEIDLQEMKNTMLALAILIEKVKPNTFE